MVGRDRPRRSRRFPPPCAARCAASASPGRCTARRCSAPTTSRCGPRSCGTTAAPSPSARRWRRPSRTCGGSPANIAMPGFTAPKLLWVAQQRAGDLRRHPHGAAAQGLCPLLHDRREGLRHVGRRRHAVARRRRARLERRAARRDRPDPRAHAARWSKGPTSPARCAPMSPSCGAWARSRWSAAAATTPRARPASAWSATAMRCFRSAPRA